MLVHAHAFAARRGGTVEHVQVELDVRGGLPSFAVIGLAGAAARDTRERVRSAVLNSGLQFPRRRVTVNLAPASSHRSGSEFDLAIACCVAVAGGYLEDDRLARLGLFAELGLGGALRPCAAAAAASVTAAEAGLDGLIVAFAGLAEARAAEALPVVGLRDLREVVDWLAAPDRRRRGPLGERGATPRAAPAPADVGGQPDTGLRSSRTRGAPTP